MRFGLDDKETVFEYFQEISIVMQDANGFLLETIRSHKCLEDQYSEMIRQNYPEDDQSFDYLKVMLSAHQLQCQYVRKLLDELEKFKKQLEDYYFHEYGFRDLQR